MTVRPLQLALAVTITTLVVYVYLFPPTDSNPSEPPKEGSVCLDYQNEDMSTLDVDLIHEMTENYRANQWTFINTNPRSKTTNDAYSIWFDIETLKKFLYHIEKITKSQDASITNDQLGVRIYYAAYPDANEMGEYPDLRPTEENRDIVNYGGLHTLVMIPTITTQEGDKFDFNPLDPETYDTPLSKIEKYTKNHPEGIPNNTAALSGTSAASRRTVARNHGLLYPPTGGSTALGF